MSIFIVIWIGFDICLFLGTLNTSHSQPAMHQLSIVFSLLQFGFIHPLLPGPGFVHESI